MNKYRIASTRMQEWDYSWNGAYFVMICTNNHACYFGNIEFGKMIYSELGSIANKLWIEIPKHFPFVDLSEFIIMPNHVHGIIIINKTNYNGHVNVETQNLASLRSHDASLRSHDASLRSNDTALRSTSTPTHHSDLPRNRFGPQSQNLASIIRGFKTGVTKSANKLGSEFRWQARYHDHIIRNHNEYEGIMEYIRNNPIKWSDDYFYILPKP